MEEIKITLETLYDILRNEKKREDLQKLNQTFFLDVVSYLKEKKILLNGQLIAVNRGSFITSIRKLAKDNQMANNTIVHFLKMLKADTMIETRSDPQKTIITICNYEKYQDNLKNTDTAIDTGIDTPTDTPTDTPPSLPLQSSSSLSSLNLRNNDNKGVAMTIFVSFRKKFPSDKINSDNVVFDYIRGWLRDYKDDFKIINAINELKIDSTSKAWQIDKALRALIDKPQGKMAYEKEYIPEKEKPDWASFKEGMKIAKSIFKEK